MSVLIRAFILDPTNKLLLSSATENGKNSRFSASVDLKVLASGLLLSLSNPAPLLIFLMILVFLG